MPEPRLLPIASARAAGRYLARLLRLFLGAAAKSLGAWAVPLRTPPTISRPARQR